MRIKFVNKYEVDMNCQENTPENVYCCLSRIEK